MKDWWTLRQELEEAKRRVVRRKVGLPAWAKTASLGLLTKVNSDANAFVNNDDPKIKDQKLASAIKTSAALTTLGLAVSSNDKTMVGRAKAMGRK